MKQEAANRALMLSLMADFKNGFLEPLFAHLSPQVEWKVTAPPEFFRSGGIRHGRLGVKEYLALLSLRYHIVRLAPVSVIAKGEEVWGLFEVEALHQPSRRTVRTDMSIRWTLEDGLITQHQCLFDTAGVLMQQGDLVAA
jgi:ketosteroid isomerase-like protein